MSIDRFAAAEAALKAGDSDEGIRLIEGELERDPEAAASIYRNFASMLFRRNDYVEAEKWASAGAGLYPKDYDLWNILGVAQRRLKKFDSAIKSLKHAEKLNPKNPSALQNRGNVYNDVKNGPASVEVFTKLVRLQPNSAEFQRSLGRGHWYSGDLAKAAMRMSLATKLKPNYVDAWLDLAAVTAELKGYLETQIILDQAMAAATPTLRLHEARVMSLRRSGHLRDAEAYLLGLLTEHGEEAWIQYQLGGVISDYDRRRANTHLEKAFQLDPDKLDYRMALIESLSRSRYGDESEHLERSYNLLLEAVRGSGEKLEASPLKVALEVLIRLADYDSAEQLGSFSDVGHTWVKDGKHTALLGHLARVQKPEDRIDLLEMHRIWGRKIDMGADRWPLQRPAVRTPNGKIRLGFMSSDLRNHPVAYFAMPLFEHVDRDRFEIYCYSYYEGANVDASQARIAELVDVFRWKKDISNQDAAQMIADDQLDMLIELGGSTHMNKLSVMAFKPAPLQASWLGYPHSAGLETIDYLILDPYVAPRDELLVEEALLMPKSWIAMGEMAFPDRPITEGTPEQRNGFLTFGTANNPYKYSRDMIRTWAQVTGAVPKARFLFIRPEGGAPSFRKNILALFAAEGVSEERVRFEDIRGAHMPFYNDIDISLDTFPQTGGTTTCESLWMGVPTVTLVGEAMFERLSYSILTSAGLGDLCATTREEFIQIALDLAADPERRQILRTDLRGMLKASPLGQTKQFASDFYDMIEGAVVRAKATGKIPVAASEHSATRRTR